MQAVRIVEGVPYYRFRVTGWLINGGRIRLKRWSPGAPFVYEEVGRELAERYGVNAIKPNSVRIELAP